MVFFLSEALLFMEITFSKTTNGYDICRAGKVLLHSSYNPQKEAERFVSTLSCTYYPSFVIITEPAISYITEILRTKYPSSKICCIRYSKAFDKWNNKWDKIFYIQGYSKSLSEQLFDYLGEEGLCTTLFASWTASQKAFPSEHTLAWKEIKKAVLKGRNVLATRSWFSKRWAKNAIKFALFFNKTKELIKPIEKNIIICASGPSLKTSLQEIKQRRNDIFLIAVSSALSVLHHVNIKPDLCISTDGGYWAKKHISFALKDFQDMPLALSPEANCWSWAFNNNPIIPLSYGDGISEDIFKCFGIKNLRAYRNGTVSGTAAKIALDISDNQLVFFCGLDMASNKGFAHTQPNELENQSSINDYRLSTKETRIAPSSFNSSALSIYKSWFSSENFNNRLFRLSNNWKYPNTLGNIKDVNWQFFDSISKNTPKENTLFYKDTDSFLMPIKKRKELLLKLIEQKKNSLEWIKEAAPAEFLLLERSISNEDKINAQKKLDSAMQKYIENISSILIRC